MKCKEIDMMGYIDGKGSEEVKIHIEGCRKCSAEAEKLRKLTSFVLSRYTIGKRMEQQLDEALRSIETSKMKRLPDAVVKKVSELKGKSLAAKLNKVIGKGEKSAKAFFEDILTGQMHALPASPKDITIPKKIKKKKSLK